MKKISSFFAVAVFLSTVTMAHAIQQPFPTNPDCSVSDMLLNGQNADACRGPQPGNDTTAALINSLFTGNPWTEVSKYDIDENTTTQTPYSGITFSVSSTGNSVGTWDLTWSGTALPATVDLVGVLKGGGYWNAFLFDNEFLAAAGTNDPDDHYEITFYNSQNHPDLSHLTLYARDVVPTNPVPEPGTIVLLGAGMLGLAVFSKRRKNN